MMKKTGWMVLVLFLAVSANASQAVISASGKSRTACRDVSSVSEGDGPRIIVALINENEAHGFMRVASTTSYVEQFSASYTNFCVTSSK
jgi:hypothetical protein